MDVDTMNQLKPQKPLIITSDQARVYNVSFGEARILLDGERSGGACWMGEFRLDQGFVTPLHLHPKADEYLYVIDGVLSVYLDDEWHDLEAGTLAVVPHSTQHAQCNAGKRPVRVLGSGNPAGFERLFPAQHELLSRISSSDAQFFSELTKVLGMYDTKVLGPPPIRP
jgi:quercetin dioxygenase-like cupin family protein